MEDAHATVLSLDKEDKQSNAFFAVYDGHGGACYLTFCPCQFSNFIQGGTIAKFASKMFTRGS
jgi:serine/threonine protein phosphatase PrpC